MKVPTVRSRFLLTCTSALCLVALFCVPLRAAPPDTLSTPESWVAAPEVIGQAAGDRVRGVVFEDVNRNGQYDDAEDGVEMQFR